MANVFNANPVVLDTVWTTGSMPSGLTSLSANPQAFTRIVWSGGTAADTILITDGTSSSNVLFSQTCPVTGQDVILWDSGSGNKKYTFKQSSWVLQTMAHGKLLLYK